MTKAHAQPVSHAAAPERFPLALELVCQVDSPVALRAAIHHGADWVRIDQGWSGVNRGFTNREDRYLLAKAIRYSHDNRRRISLDLSSCAANTTWRILRDVVDVAACAGIDAILVADPALLLYVAARRPGLQLHYALPARSTTPEAIASIQRTSEISRILLPAGVSLAQVHQLATSSSPDMEICALGGLVLPARPTPPSARLRQGTRTHGFILDKLAVTQPRDAYSAVASCGDGEAAFNDPLYSSSRCSSATVLRSLPELAASRVRGLCVPADARAPTRLAHVLKVWRDAIDSCMENLESFTVKPSWTAELGESETTLHPS